MTYGEFVAAVTAELGFEPNDQQRQVIEALARFCSPARSRQLDIEQGSRDRVFLLNGYAGTGKTSLSGALVRALARAGIRSRLLAPTGRAAKVFSALAGKPAYTIHRTIYRHSLGGEMPGLQTNNTPDTVFIVDEASMIGDEDMGGGPFGTVNEQGGLLADLIQYVYGGEGCRMILLGDTAQLPPVGSDISPAMDPDTLRQMGLTVSRATLTTIARQGALSGILANATTLRRAMKSGDMPMPHFVTAGYKDVSYVTPEDMPEYIDTCYQRDGMDQTIIVTRSNRRAVDFNRGVRAQVLYYEEELTSGELLMVAKNNYRWSRGVRGLDFIANGDTLEVTRVYGTEDRYGVRFADVQLTLPSNRAIVFDAKVMVDTLTCDAPGMGPGMARNIYNGIVAEMGGDPDRVALACELRDNPYWNALVVKYAYAVTCHKAQGGQWQNVFVDLGYIPEDGEMAELYRWLYTAVTRARTRLYIIAPADE